MTSILVVDDDAQFRSALARELVDQGMVVDVAPSVDEAVSLLARMNIDVLVTDLRMSDRDGIDLLTTVREISSHTRTILMSAYATARDYQTALDLGAVKVLFKPFTPTEALEAIRQAVDCSTGFRGSLHGLSLVDMLQMFHYGRRSLCIAVGGSVPGTICFRDGQIVHAQRGPLQGEPALCAILAAKSGSVTTSVLGNPAQTVTRDFQGLLLDLLRQVDESSEVSPSEMDFELDVRPSTQPPKRRSSSPPASRSSNSVRPDAPSGLARLLETVAERAAKLSPEVAVAVVHLSTGEVSGAAGPPVDPTTIESLRGIMSAAHGIADAGPLKVECLGHDTAFALVALDAAALPDATLFVGNVLVGRYAALKFRSDVGRLASVLEARDPHTGGIGNGKN